MTGAAAGLWELVLGGRHAILATVATDGRPQLTNDLYVIEPQTRVIRTSTTAGRVKARNLSRDPRAALHVGGDDFWAYAVVEGTTTLSADAATPGDEAVQELRAVHTGFYGEQEQEAFSATMIANRRLVIRLEPDNIYGVIAPGAKRPRQSG
jgi:PPOX class probable F420-dependent enzyme